MSHRDCRYSRARFLEIFKTSELQFNTRVTNFDGANYTCRFDPIDVYSGWSKSSIGRLEQVIKLALCASYNTYTYSLTDSPTICQPLSDKQIMPKAMTRKWPSISYVEPFPFATNYHGFVCFSKITAAFLNSMNVNASSWRAADNDRTKEIRNCASSVWRGISRGVPLHSLHA